MQPKLALLTVLERGAAAARRIGFGALVDRAAPHFTRPFERFSLEVDGVALTGTDLAQLHYVRELREQGRERTFVRLLAEAVPAGGVVLEGGPHLGFVTVHAARAAGPTGRVLAFEPDTSVHPVLRENLSLNRVADRVELRSEALGDRPGRARFYRSGDTGSLYTNPEGADEVDVEIVRADDAVEGTVDVVKLDIEGGEPAALRGMVRLVRGARALFLECNPALLERAGSSTEELLAWLDAHSFDVQWIDEAAGRTRPTSEPWADAYVNLVCRRRS